MQHYSKRQLIDFLATGFYSGKFPVAPGTAGSIAAFIISIPLVYFFPGLLSWTAGSIIAIVFTLFAIYVANQAVDLGLYGEDNKDPKQIVIDEFAGYFCSIVGFSFGFRELLLGLVFFRLFDITKPPPVRQFEKLPRGWGIVLDDVVAGIIANLCAHLALAYLF